jgi:hypothetical protein
VVKTFYHFLQWWYLIAQASHSEDTIAIVEAELIAFAENVKIFKSYSKKLFNFPKFHSMVHYTSFIRSRGSLDNFTTEHFEHQHIIDAKEPFRHTNKKEPIIQMLSWISRRDIMNLKRVDINQQDYIVDHSNGIVKSRLGSALKPAKWRPIDVVECCYKLRSLYISIQSWMHTYLCDGIGMNGRLKRVRRSHLPRLHNARVSNGFIRKLNITIVVNINTYVNMFWLDQDI